MSPSDPPTFERRDRARRPRPPLDAAALERLALRYVERFATTRARLADRLAALGYIDDRGFGESRAAAMARRGLGAGRVRQALRAAGVAGEDAAEIEDGIADRRLDAAIVFARRKRIGPFAIEPADRSLRERQMGAMLRAGHDSTLARRIVSMAPGDDPATLADA